MSEKERVMATTRKVKFPDSKHGTYPSCPFRDGWTCNLQGNGCKREKCPLANGAITVELEKEKEDA